MYRDNVVGVVVPAYNEEGFVGEVIETLPPFVDRAYVIDDCSTDGTWAEIQSAAERIDGAGVDTDHGADYSVDADHGADADRSRASVPTDDRLSDGGTVGALRRVREGDGTDHAGTTPEARFDAEETTTADGTAEARTAEFDRRICPIRHDRNRGVGGAIKTGYQRALDDSVDVVAVMGGDGQMRPEELPSYLDPIVDDEVDYTKGNRLLSRELREEMSSWRLFGNWILTFLTKIASGYWRTMDPQNGYTAISREALESIEIDRMYEDYGYCNDLLVRLNVAGLRVGDVPRRANYGDEESDIRYHTYIPRVSAMLLRDFLWRLRAKYLVRRFHPLALLYGVGAAAAGVGSVSLARAVVSRVRGSDTVGEGGSAERGAPLTGAVLVAVGWATMLLAMVFDLEENADRERRFER
jgi:glycosyltransferase involved in cell wall biosynthesis